MDPNEAKIANKLENAAPGVSRKAEPNKTRRSVENLPPANPPNVLKPTRELHFCIFARTSKSLQNAPKQGLLEAGLAPQMEKLDDRTTSQK